MPFSNAQHRMSPAAANCSAGRDGCALNASTFHVDVGKDPLGSLLGLHGLHRTFRDQRPAPRPRRIIDFVHDALSDGRRLRILRVIDQWGRHSPLLEGAARPSRTRSVDEALDFTAFPFGTNAELVACIAHTFGIRIPAISCCTAHRSPAQRLRGRAPRLLIIWASYLPDVEVPTFT